MGGNLEDDSDVEDDDFGMELLGEEEDSNDDESAEGNDDGKDKKTATNKKGNGKKRSNKIPDTGFADVSEYEELINDSFLGRYKSSSKRSIGNSNEQDEEKGRSKRKRRRRNKS